MEFGKSKKNLRDKLVKRSEKYQRDSYTNIAIYSTFWLIQTFRNK